MKVFKITATMALLALLCMGLLAGAVQPRAAQAAPGSAGSSGSPVKGYDDWHFSVNLAGWLTSFQGDVRARGNTSSVDVDFKDVLDLLFHGHIDFTMDGRFEVSKGPWGLYAEVEYVRLSDSGEGAKSIEIPILHPLEFTLRGKADVLTVYSTGEAALTYDVYASPCLVANMPEVIVEVLGGARYQYIRTKAELELAGPFRVRNFYTDKSRSWVDPIVGGRFSWRPGADWITSLQTDFGGFTVNSDFTFNVRAEAAYSINRWLFVNAGYRALYTDYETGSGDEKFAYNLWVHGPFLGVGVKF